ncbi:hypothetical protein DMA15_19735 [Streptomyces sp. WAC 01529]|uniref:chaplin n=1 Tax=Streptomyces sp. WAC 01529 TaxID=2203205 RepID=UPI000F71ED29|nr:chaplin [Streptomyces sp. WAC 01529]AZM54520.1 hypothetical protein DMA15_19735 [Streptomyces sp. WAC 01529]
MRQALSKGMLSAAAATSILSLSGTSAFADSEASGQASGSPGVLSGNSVQAPLEVPVNICGNSVNGVGAANPAAANKCANTSTPAGRGHDYRRGAGSSPAAAERRGSAGPASGATARGEVANSPGVLSGNNVKAPVEVPVNVCGNSVNGVAAVSPATGNSCGGPRSEPHAVRPPFVPHPPGARPDVPGPRDPGREPGAEAGPAPTTPRHAPQATPADHPVHATGPGTRLAETGMDGTLLGAAAAGTGLLLGGAILYRRGRTAPAHR